MAEEIIWDYYEKEDKGASSATVSYLNGRTSLVGQFAQQNMLKQFAGYERGVGNSMLPSFKFVPATVIEDDMKTVDAVKQETDYVRNGFAVDDMQAILARRTQNRIQNYRMQVFPVQWTQASDAINKHEALTIGGGDASVGTAMITGGEDFITPMLHSETLHDNQTFLKEFKRPVTEGIKFKPTRWDGSIGQEDITVPYPEWLKYETIDSFLKPEDLLRIRARMDNNMVNTPGVNAPRVALMSPLTAERLLENNKDKDNILHYALFGRNGPEQNQPLPAYGFEFAVNMMMPDNQIFIFAKRVTMTVFDWGTLTEHMPVPMMPSMSQILRTGNYGVKVTQPMTMMHVKLKGLTEEYEDNRLNNLITETDEPLKPIRRTPKKVVPGA